MVLSRGRRSVGEVTRSSATAGGTLAFLDPERWALVARHGLVERRDDCSELAREMQTSGPTASPDALSRVGARGGTTPVPQSPTPGSSPGEESRTTDGFDSEPDLPASGDARSSEIDEITGTFDRWHVPQGSSSTELERRRVWLRLVEHERSQVSAILRFGVGSAVSVPPSSRLPSRIPRSC